MDVMGWASDECDSAWDEPTGGTLSSQGWAEDAGDGGSSSVNTEARRMQ